MISSSVNRDQRARALGFTLIELLVVISIIALLIAMLLPSLQAARSRSKQSACLARIKSIATSSHVYAADDREGMGIPVHPQLLAQDRENATFIGAYEWGGKSGIGEPGFADGPTNGKHAWVSSKYGTKAGFGPATRPLNDVLFPGGLNDNLVPFYDRAGAKLDTQLKLDLYRCPADDGPPRGAHCPDWLAHSERSSYDHFGNSYAANLLWFGGSKPGWTEVGIASLSPYTLALSRVPNASRTLMYEENIGRWAWACRRWAPMGVEFGVDPGPTKAVRGWHGRDWTFNRAFVDAHAETQRVIIEGTEDEHGYFEHFRWEHTEFWSFRIRGDGWQKDTWQGRHRIQGEVLDLPLWESTGRQPCFEGCVTFTGSAPALVFPTDPD